MFQFFKSVDSYRFSRGMVCFSLSPMDDDDFYHLLHGLGSLRYIYNRLLDGSYEVSVYERDLLRYLIQIVKTF